MKRLFLAIATFLTFFSHQLFSQYLGGENDGASSVLSCALTLGGSSAFSLSAVSGSSEFCAFSTETYSATVTGTVFFTYSWTVPAGASIVSGQGTSSILVLFGNTSGNVQVNATNDCTTLSNSLAVSAGICDFFKGGINDGSSSLLKCASTLNGSSVFIPGPIIGSGSFCDFASEAYSISVAGALPNTVYVWSVPAGATITTGQGTSSIFVVFGNSNGSVSVDVSNECETVNVALPVSSASCIFYSGGVNDGFSGGQKCASNLNGGSVFSPGLIVGPVNFCDFASEVYSITVAGAPPNTMYTWSVPAGATITSGQGTSSILVSFGNSNGSVSVDVSNDCETINVALPVSSTACTFYAGGINDGFSDTQRCASNLNGGSVFIPGSIVGPSAFCSFSSEVYSIAVAGALPNTVYVWNVPAGASIVSGQGTSSILVSFGNSNGSVSVDVSNDCETINVALPVSSTACTFYAGGINDGFSDTQRCASNLNGGSVFIPGSIVGPSAFCSFSSEVYSIAVAGALPNTVYVWSVPAGASIVSGQGTNSILVSFGGTNGSVSVDVSNECETVNVALPVSSTPCTFYAGGINDGFSLTQKCTSSLNGTSAFAPGSIVGPAGFCDFSSEVYSITVAGALPSTVYVWSVPAGATIVSGQGTNSILVSFGNTNGSVGVAVSSECETINVALPVSSTLCTFYAGGINDGFSTTANCISGLNGTSGFIPGPVAGFATFCPFSSESYTIVVAGANASTTYVWSGPPGSTITSGQGTNTVLITFGNTAGNVSVVVANACQTIGVSTAVAPVGCTFYAGGQSDGFSVATVFNIPLPVELVAFTARPVDGVVYLEWTTASEINNDFFQVERSQEGDVFYPVVKVEGSGTSVERLNYSAEDVSPYSGTSYYRLLQSDFDGRINYSHVVSVRIDDRNLKQGVVGLYPNPVRNGEDIHVEYYSKQPQKLNILIVNPTGMEISSREIQVQEGSSGLKIQAPPGTSGVFILFIRSRTESHSFRIVVL